MHLGILVKRAQCCFSMLRVLIRVYRRVVCWKLGLAAPDTVFQSVIKLSARLQDPKLVPSARLQ